MANTLSSRQILLAPDFKLKPLVVCMRVAIVGGMLVSVIGPAQAELPIPVQGGQGWVSSGSATHQIIGNTMKIEQKSDKAILNWQKFNVGKDHAVEFAQPGKSSIALNRIFQQDPSKIFGKIVANGQVYLYNKNGFVFGKDSSINTNSLIATTLNISDEVFERGVTRVFDEGKKAALVIEPMKPGDTLDPKTAKILIEAGAKIHTDKAGRIIIAAPVIENHGSLTSEAQGQIIMAASQDKVYLQAADKDSPFAGLLVEVDTGGKVTNAGDILAKQGNVTLAGFAVNQQGRVSATTSVNVNGSIRLLAKEKADLNSKILLSTETERDTELNDGLGKNATVKLAAGSVTEVVADAEGGSAIDEQKQPDSYLEIVGKQVELQSGSKIRVPGGKVKVTATDNVIDPSVGTKGRLFIDSNASIDVSGYKNVDVAMERNVGEISVQSFELRDAPLQRNGVLKGKTIRVDLRKGSKIVDISGAKARISRDIQERLANGGEISLTSSGDMIANDGAQINISGGSVKYRDGFISSTKLFTEYGRFVDISDADPNQKYTNFTGEVIESYEKWGVEKVWKILDVFGLGNFERGYVEGKNAGKLNIVAPRLAWGGTLKAGSESGGYQRAQTDLPFGGSFNIDLAAFQSAQTVRFQNAIAPLSLDPADEFPEKENQEATDLLLLSDMINQSGLGELSVKTWGNAIVDQNADISMSPGAKFSIEAANIDFDGRVNLAGGSVNLKTSVLGSSGETAANQVGRLALGSNAVMDVSGLWINDLHPNASKSPTDPLVINGGSVSLEAEGDLLMNAGSVIRADGGAWLPVSGKLKAGDGGDISLAAKGNGSEASTLTLAGQLSAYGLEQNGTLTLESGKIIVGTPTKEDDIKQTLLLGVSNGSFDFSQQLAFSEITLRANFGDLKVKSNVNLTLRQKNLLLQDDYLMAESGESLRSFTLIGELADYLRQSTKLSLAAAAGIKQEKDSILAVENGGSISLSTQAGNVFVDGALHAPGGNININIKPSDGLEYDGKQAIWIGEHARMLAQGMTRLQPVDVFGHRSGEVLDGGQIVIDAQRGFLVTAQGSMLDVSGVQTKLHMLQDGNGLQPQYTEQNIASNAGTISVTAAEGIILKGKMRAVAGSATAHGGKLEMSLDRSKRNPPFEPKAPFPSQPLMLNVMQTARRTLEDDFELGDVFPDSVVGQASLVADQVDEAGFTRLDLESKSQVVFVGSVKLNAAESIKIDAPVIRAAESGVIDLQTSFLQIGAAFNRTVADSAEIGGAKFSAHADWIQLIGATQWNGFDAITLDSQHDLRTLGLRNETKQRDYVGALVTAADLHLHASQIYPTTLTDFSFVVKNNPDGRILITGANTDKSPLSAAGSLTFDAPVIVQQGVLKAPFGTINLKARDSLTLAQGSLTSVSAAGSSIPFGVTQGGLDWLYELDSLNNLVYEAAPEKRLVLSGAEIEVAEGSTVDLSGGGNLLSYEFLPGAGGSFDYLKPGSESYQGGFAVLPTLGSKLAPYDHFESNAWSYAPGSSVYLSGVDGLPAGEYAILPARYALLDGAFLVTPQAGTQDQSITQKTVDGRSIISGYFMQAGGEVRDARSSGFLIETAADVRLHSKYELYNANDFYRQQAEQRELALPILPMDGGHISLIAETKLIMDGNFVMDAVSGGKGAKMDIAANRILVANQFSQTPTEGTLEILADDLSALNVDSLLLGGARTRNNQTGETDIAVTSQQVVFGNNTKLQGAEILAVASDLVEVQAGAIIDANRQVDTGDTVLNITGDGALLRVSGSKQVEFNRSKTNGDTGVLRLAAGSKLRASESMLLDASRTTELLGDLEMQGGSLNLAANTINIGEVDNLGGNALNLSNRKFANLTVDELVLTGRDSIGVYGNVGQVNAQGNPLLGADGIQKAISFERLLINSAGFTGHGTDKNRARLQAGILGFNNTGSVTNKQTIDGQGSLELVADNLLIADGDFALHGFNAVNIYAANQIRAVGQGNLNVTGHLQATTAALTADGGAKVKINATGYQASFNHLLGNVAVDSGYAGSIAVVANTIKFNSQVILPSGSLDLHALTGDLTLGEKASLDLAGRSVQFADKKQYTPGGSFKAVADHGKLSFAAGSVIDIDSGGGNAAGGKLILQAPEKTLELSGQLQGAKGSAFLDVADFEATANFDTLMQKLGVAGMTESIYFRTHKGEINQSSDSTIVAKEVTLVADTGAMNLAGSIDASATDQGGSIKLYAGDKITLNGGKLSAKGIASGAKGGSVLLSSVDADNDDVSGIEIKESFFSDGNELKVQQPLIDVSGQAAEGGEVILRALRTADSVNIQPIKGTVRGYKAFYAEGVKKYGNTDLGNDGRIDSADISKIQNETDTYMSAVNMLNVAQNLGQGIRLMPGVEINYSGDLVLQDKWDLVDWRYDENVDDNVWDNLPGRLAIRTDGNLLLQQSLTDGFKNEDFEYEDAQGAKRTVSVIDKLQNGASWSYQLIAGSDLNSADTNTAVLQKDLTVGSNVRVRTGSGDIQLNAGGDMVISAGEEIENKAAIAVARNASTIPVADIGKWKVGGYLSGSGIASGTFILAIESANVTYKTTASIASGSLSLQIGEDFTGWKVGDYLSGVPGIASGTLIDKIDSTGTSQVLLSKAIQNSQSLVFADTSGWVVGDVITGSGFAANTTVTSIDKFGLAKTSAAQAIQNSLALRLSNTTGLVVGDYLQGTGIADGTVITRIGSQGVSQTVGTRVTSGSTIRMTTPITGWVVGDYLTGTGIAANTVITAINNNTVTLNKPVTGAINVNTRLTTLAAIHINKPTVAVVNANASIRTLPSVHISQAINTEIAENTTVVTLPSVHLSKSVTQAISNNASIKTLPYVTLSSPVTLAVNSGATLKASYTAGSVYSAGTNSASKPYGSLSDRAVGLFFYSQYPVNGGDVSLTATGNINGTVSGNDFNDWLLRIGEWPAATNNAEPTAWGVALSYIPGAANNTQPGRSPAPLFQQNLGSFGGGKVTVKAGGDINDLEVVMPTTGKQIGNANGSFNLLGFSSNQVELNGGGTLQIIAGGNITGGSYYLGRGQGSVTAGGEVKGDVNYENGPSILLGDTRFSINAGKDLSLSGVTDPMIAHKGDVNFFSYSADSGLDFASLSGDVSLRANGTLFVDSERSSQQSLAAIFPASLEATAFGGSILAASQMTLFPSAIGQLNLFAEQDIYALDLGSGVGMSDADISLMPGAESPLASSNMSLLVSRLEPFGLPEFIYAKTPVHTGDSEPARLVTRQGDITNIGFILAKQALIKAGRDIANLNLSLQHVGADDITLLEAGRDISYTSERDDKTGALLGNFSKIQIGGPGNVLVKSGRNTDLGASGGISTVGNVVNSNLPDTGANLTLMVGSNGKAPDYIGFMAEYQPGIASIQAAIDVVQGMADFANKAVILVTLKNLQGMKTDFRSTHLSQLGAELQTMIDQPKQILQSELAAKNQLKLSLPDSLDLSKQITDIKQKNDRLETLALQTRMLESGSKLVGDFMRNLTGKADLSDAQARQLFKELKQEDYLSIQPKLDLLMAPVLFKELKHAGSASAVDKSTGNTSGYAAINSLFPSVGGDSPVQDVGSSNVTLSAVPVFGGANIQIGGGGLGTIVPYVPVGSTGWQGDLSMFFSKIHTVDGGDINLLVPGGEVNTGLAVSFTGLKLASELGIVAQRQGDINAMVNDDFLVNTSRVFSLDGSDILIWSSEGDIDAGRGAKSAIAAPPPNISFDEDGNLVIEFPPIVSGSGIRTAASSEGVTPGDVYLFAPKGVVDAGEAGIGGSNVTISATAVLGATNIQVDGVGTGVPVASTGSLAAGLTGTSNLSSGVSQMAESAVNSDVSKDNASSALAKAVLGILSVEVLGFGE